MNMHEQTAVVTGSGNGIGQAIVHRFAEAGANVIIVDTDSESADRTATNLRSKGIEAKSVECDVTDPADVQAVAATAEEQFGGIDILVNNAGVTSRGSFDNLTLDQWRNVLDVNLTGVFNCCREIVPQMVEQGYGRVVNISSMAGRNISYYGGPDYTASKWGVIGLTKHLAWELGPSVTVNAVCPGPTMTERFRESTDEEKIKANEQEVPLKKLAEPQDQAEAVFFLASEEGEYINGTTIDVDGGLQLSIRHDI